MTPGLPTISAAQLAELFPFHVAIDDDLRITSMGASTARIAGAAVGGAFLETFVVERPSGSLSVASLRRNPQQLYVIRMSSGLRLRGQMLCLPGQGQTIFLCTPLLADASQMSSVGLSFSDFAVHDATPELVQVMKSQQIALDDLRRLADRLKQQGEELKATNARLEAQSAEARKLALIASRTDNGVLITDAHGYTEWVNDGFERMTGRTLEELRGKKPGQVLQDPASDPAVVAYMGRQVREGEGFVAELLNRHKNGTPYWVHIEAQPIHDQTGALINFMAIERDITDLKRRDAELLAAVQRAEQANLAKTEFLANVSHEIRTPLHTIIGMTALLREGSLAFTEQQLAKTVATSAESLLEIVNDLLDVAKIEAGQITIERAEFDPIEMCETAVTQLRQRVRPGVLLTVAHAGRPTPLLIGDALRLRQIVVNLVGNALKFTTDGQVSVRVGTEQREDGATSLVITVDDTGIGILPEERHRIFEKFFRAGGSQKFGGVGLGLSISQLLAQTMGGRIRLEDKPGQGARFLLEVEVGVARAAPAAASPPGRVWIEAEAADAACLADVFRGVGATVELPQERGAPHRPGEVIVRRPGGVTTADGREFPLENPLTPSGALSLLSTGPAISAPPRSNRTEVHTGRVLVIDDNPDGRNYVRLTLAREGFDVVTGGTMSEAIELSARGHFDTILMDIGLPDGSGIDATRIIRERERAAGASPTPIVALSAHGMRHHRDAAMAAGVDDYLTKPVKPGTLLSMVSHFVIRGTARSPDVPPEIEVEPDIADLVAGYLERVRQRAGDSEQQLKAGHTADARRFAHDLKGTGTMFGFHRLGVFGGKIEAAILADDLHLARTLTEELLGELEQLRWRVRP